jgi:hypothetical protein
MKGLIRFAKFNQVWIEVDKSHKINSIRPERGGDNLLYS